MAVTVEYAGLTDIGRVRKNNEDHFLIADLVKMLRIRETSLMPPHMGGWKAGVTGYMFVVADGMGGLSGGEVASGLAVETISWYVAKTMPWFYRYQDGREKELEEELKQAVMITQETVQDAAERSRFPRMGTTLTLACMIWPRLYVVHAGDSRCYLRRGGVLKQVTTDHTVAQRAVDEGVLTKSQAEMSGLGHALWNCIGAGQQVQPELSHFSLQMGDELLLCTDGLTRRLTEDDILAIVDRHAVAADAVKALVAAANEAGGQDNITVILARTRPGTDPHATPREGVAFVPDSGSVRSVS